MAKQKPEFSTVTTKNIPLLLAYDKLAPTEADFRDDLIAFLIQNGATNLQCFVATTIYFETTVTDRPITHWSALLSKKFGETFHYHLVRIFIDNKDRPNYTEFKRTELSTNFSTKVIEIITTPPKI